MIGQGGRAIEPPAAGVMLARSLAEKLDAAPGDVIEFGQTRGRRLRVSVQVSAIVEPMLGSSAYMELNALARLMREPGRITGSLEDGARVRARR